MGKKFVILVTMSVLIMLGSRCSPTMPEPPIFPEKAEISAEVVTSTDVDFELFQNKSQGYSVLRPAKWYWRHYIDSEIENQSVVDLFITDNAPLSGLGSKNLGLIVIEVSTKPMNELAEDFQGFVEADEFIGGEMAKRFDGLVLSRNIEGAIVEYQFSHKGKTFRIYVNNAENNLANIKIFEAIVNSFKFVN